MYKYKIYRNRNEDTPLNMFTRLETAKPLEKKNPYFDFNL